MSTKHIPERTCIACRKKDDRSSFFRVVLDREKNTIIFDKDGSAPGRGAYICRRLGCIETAKRKKSFCRAFKRTLSADTVLQELEEELDGGKTG